MESFKKHGKWSLLLVFVLLFTAMFGNAAYMEGNTAITQDPQSNIVQAVAMASANVAFLTKGGNVYVNGSNSLGLYGNNTTEPTYGEGFQEVTIDGDTPLSGIDRLYGTGGSMLYAWDKDAGKLYAWGDNGFMRGGVSGFTSRVLPVATEVNFLGAPIHFAGNNPQDIIVNNGTVLLIDADGQVWSWGSSAVANTNPASRVIDFRLGREVTLDFDKDVNDTAANDSNGNCLVNMTDSFVCVTPGIVHYTSDPEEKAIAVGGGRTYTSYILTNKGNVYVFGGASISPPDRRFKKVTDPSPGNKFVKLSVASGGAALLLDDAGQLYRLNPSDTTDAQSNPVKPDGIYGNGTIKGNPAAAASKFTKIAVAGSQNNATFFAQTDQGEVYVWGKNTGAIAAMNTSSGTYSNAVKNTNLQGADDFGAHLTTGVMLKQGKLYTWGSNLAGQLANGTTVGVATGTPKEVLPENLAGGVEYPKDPGDVAPPPPPMLPNPFGADFMINNNRVQVDRFEGWGSQYNQNLYADITAHEYGTTPENVVDLENKVIRLGSQQVRIFYDPDYYDAIKYDLKDPSKGTTIADPNAQSFYKTVELAQRSGSSVNITYWHNLDPDPAEREQEMHTFANLVYDLIVNKHLTSVKELTILNEPNGGPIDLGRYEAQYRNLDANLKDLGIRDKVKIVGGDLVGNNRQVWLEYMAYKMNDILDAVSVHLYWSYWSKDSTLNALKTVRGNMDDIAYSKQMPIYITEYGVRGYKDANSSDPRYWNYAGMSTPELGPDTVETVDMPLAAFQHAWFNMQSANLGFVGTSRWDAYQAKYDSGMQNFSMIGKGADGYPLRPGYYQLMLMTSTTKPGWKVVGAESASTDSSKVATAFLGPNGEQTIFALNNTANTVPISMGGLTPGKTYTVYNWNQYGNGFITYGGTVQSDANGMIRVNVNKEAFAAITSLPADMSLITDPVPPVTTAVLDKSPVSGWFNSDVAVTLSATDNFPGALTTQYSLDGGASWTNYTAPVVVATEGVNTLAYRTIDASGNTEEAKTVTIRIDRTAPVFKLYDQDHNEFLDGVIIADSLPISLTVDAVDNLSGVAGATVKVDGAAYVQGTLLDMAGKLGSHTVEVSVTDNVYNTVSASYTIKVETSTPSMSRLIEKYTSSGDLKGPLVPQLVNSLAQAVHQADNGSYDQAAKQLEDFVKQLENEALQTNISPNAKAVLKTDALAMIVIWSGK